MKRTMARLASVMLMVVLLLSMATTTTFAASGSKTDPYGFVWLDETNDIWYFQYYVYNSRERAYEIEDYAYLKGNKLYDSEGDRISSSVRAMDDDYDEADKPTVCFLNGNLYFIGTNGKVCKMSSSTASTYSVASSVTNAKYFELDADELGSRVSSKYLTSLSFSGKYDRDGSNNNNTSGNESEKSGNYVLTYAYNGDPTKIAYDAYKDDELLISVYCKNSNVWVQTEGLLLSETCVGAKFVGYSHDYFTILYDLDGTVYAFAHDNFDKALPISLGEEIMSYKKDEDGFVESITTTRKTYDLDDLLDDYGYSDYTKDISYVKNTSTRSRAFTEYDEVIHTLSKSNNYLYWNDKKLSNSYNCTYLGITEDGYPVWINSAGALYYYNGSTSKLIASNVTLLRYDKDGFAYEYKVGTKTYDLIF